MTTGDMSSLPQRQRQDRRSRWKSNKRNSADKGKGIASSSAHPTEEEPEIEEHTTAPWPRPDNIPFTGAGIPLIPNMTAKQMRAKVDFAHRKFGQAWANFNSTFYNGFLRIGIQPTRYACEKTLRNMGIFEDVKRMLIRMGLGTMATRSYPLYPELVRQFLSSVEVTYSNEKYPVASEGILTYLSSGKLYSLSIHELCDLYGFDKFKEDCSFPEYEDFPEFPTLWKFIAVGDCVPRANKLSLIRNPAVRIVAKILGHTLFGKEETGSLRTDELLLIHCALPSFAYDIYSDTHPPPQNLDTNLGAIFAQILVQKKFRALATANAKIETVGSLLTPIFRFHDINVNNTELDRSLSLIDETYLKNTHSLKPGYKYKFTDRNGTSRYCQLPAPSLTALTSIQNLEFFPAEEHLFPVGTRARSRGSSSRPSTSQPHLEDDRVPDYFVPQDPSLIPTAHTMEQLLPDYSGEYDLSPISADASDREFREWMIKNEKKKHSMMTRIWGALAKLKCPRPPSFCRAEETDAVETDAATVDPDVAGHGTTETTETRAPGPPPTRKRPLRDTPTSSEE